MRKIVSIIAALCIVATTLFAVSYTNNTYHKLAEEYTEKAQKALDAGYYELAEEYAAEAKKNAALSEEFIAMMLAKTEAEEAIEMAKARMNYALENGVDANSTEYKSALSYLNKAQEEYENAGSDVAEFAKAKADAEKVTSILSDDFINAIKEKDAAKNAAQEALDKAKEALAKAEEAGVPVDSDEYKAAKDYYDQAQKDFDDGNYESAKDNAEKAVEALNGDAVKNLLAKKDAEDAITKAKEALDNAEKAGLDDSYPLYKEAKDAYQQAQREYADEKYPEAIENANKVVELLSEDSVKDQIDAAKKAAEDAIAKAKEALDKAEEAGIDQDSDEYKQAKDYYNKALNEFDNQEYNPAKDDAEKVNEILSDDVIDALNKAKAEAEAEKSEAEKALADAKKAAEDAIAKAKEALDNAKEAGLDVKSDPFQEALEYYAAAIDAYNDGDYEKAKTDAEKVLDVLDPSLLDDMKAKADAEAAIAKARERISAAHAAGLDPSFVPYQEALDYYRGAQTAFADEDYATAKEKADKVAELLSDEAIDAMLDQADAENAKSAAEGALIAAKERLDYAEGLGLDVSDDKFNAALAYYNRAMEEFADENYPDCTDDANAVLDILSDAYLSSLISRSEAEKAIAAAQERLKYAESINAPRDFPIAYNAAQAYFAQALDDYTAEQYEKAIADANKVIDALADIHEMSVLPKYYIVRPWAESKDCFWNISGRSYVYNNPWLWENLYEANKDNIPERNNPNLILPGMKMEIPSISGEYRDGVYSPDVEYGTFSANR